MSWTGRWIQHLVLARVPLIVLAGLVALAVPGADGMPTLVNMRIMESAFDLGLAVFLTLLVCVVSGHHALQIWQLAPVRFATDPPRIPAFFHGRTAFRRLPFTVFAVPLILRLWTKNSFDAVDSELGFWRSTAAVLLAVAAMAGLLLAMEALRKRLAGWLDGFGPFVRLARWLGDGYWDPSARRIEPGHALAVAWALLLTALYVAGYFVLHPLRSGHDLVPTLAYVLGLILLLESVLSGASFFLDRFRAPLLTCLLIFAGVTNYLFPKDHYFEIRDSPAEPPSLRSAVGQRLELQRRFVEEDAKPILTVVAAGGGGIQAAAWTAQVLAGLQLEIGEDFTRSIHLVSSVSGGSVGSFFFFRGVDETLGAPGSGTLQAIRDATTSSSLEATAWGLVYPDFLRGFLPFLVERRYDRAWAMELSWLEAASRMLYGEGSEMQDGAELWLSDWMEAAADGWMPGVVFNTTVVEDGRQLSVSNVGLGGGSLAERYPGYGTVDLPLVTGPRLSATFPYVTPQARALSREDEHRDLPGWHLADGGYFDNSGLVAALGWLLELGAPAAEGEPWGAALEPFGKVVLIQISAFPPKCPPEQTGRVAGARRDQTEATRGWFYAALGPVLAILRVRTSVLVSRNDLEIQLLKRFLDERVEPFVFRPVPRCLDAEPEPREVVPAECQNVRPRDPPLSWHLSESDKQTLLCDWQSDANREQLERLMSHFRSTPTSHPPESPSSSPFSKGGE